MSFNTSHVMSIDKRVDPDIEITEYSAIVKVKYCIDNDFVSEMPDSFIARRLHDELSNLVNSCSEFEIKTGFMFLNKEDAK